MTVTPEIAIGFGADGQPDRDWLGCHERSARACAETSRADALAWLIAAFDQHAMLVPGGDHDPDTMPRQRVLVGSYRLFEFSAAREGMRTAQVSSVQDVAAIRSGVAVHDTYENIAREEISACIGNFLCVTGYAPELDTCQWQQRWVATVPAQVPTRLRAFTDGYLEVMRSTDAALPDHREALQRYSEALGRTFAEPFEDFDAAADRAHARRVVLHEISSSTDRVRNAGAAEVD